MSGPPDDAALRDLVKSLDVSAVRMAPGSMRSVVTISWIPALPSLVVVTRQVAAPPPLPVFVTLISTESPPGTETGGDI